MEDMTNKSTAELLELFTRVSGEYNIVVVLNSSHMYSPKSQNVLNYADLAIQTDDDSHTITILKNRGEPEQAREYISKVFRVGYRLADKTENLL